MMVEIKANTARISDHLKVRDEKILEEDKEAEAKENANDNNDNEGDKSDEDKLNNDDTSYDPIERHEGKGLPTLEDEEDEMLSLNAKLFRYDMNSKEWKERGNGNMRFMKHRETKKVRLIMRRMRVGKLCSNHYITTDMKLKPHSCSDKSYIWTTTADMSDGTPSQEMLAITFSKVEEAAEFKKKFEEVQEELRKNAA